jgi:hypothetical protein
VSKRKNAKKRRGRPERRAAEILAEAQRKGKAHTIREIDLPAAVLAAVREDEARARPNKMPLTCIRPAGMGPEDAVVIIRLEVFARYFDVAPAEADGEEEVSSLGAYRL